MGFCPKSSWQCPEPLCLGSLLFSALPCSDLVLCALGIPTLEQWQIFPPGTVFCGKVAVISGGGRCWGTHSLFPGHRAVRAAVLVLPQCWHRGPGPGPRPVCVAAPRLHCPSSGVSVQPAAVVWVFMLKLFHGRDLQHRMRIFPEQQKEIHP